MRELLSRWAAFAARIPGLSVAHRLALRTFETSTHQEKLDTERAYGLALYHQKNIEKFKQSGQNHPSPDYTHIYSNDLSTFYSRQKDFLSEYQTKQTLELFNYIKQKGPYSPYPNPIQDERTDMDKYLESNLDIKYDVGTSGPKIAHPEGFNMQIRKSAIDHPAAGYGVFVEGKVLPGTLLAFYPGTVYVPQDLKPDFFENRNTEYMIARYDGHLIDGRLWDQQAFKRFRKFAQYSQFGIDMQDAYLHKYQNPFGIGNYINHPPKGKEPNVMVYSFDFLREFPDDLTPFIPNEDYRKISFIHRNFSVRMRTLLLIATKHIHDEELYLNYRFNPKNKTPEWYQQPDDLAASRRWGKLGLIL